MAELSVTADAADVAMAMQVLTDLAHARPSVDPDGVYVSMDQRRVDSFVEVFRRVRDGQDLPGVPVRRERELGLVLHADTFFGAGPAAHDPAEICGLGQPVMLDPVTAREHAHALIGTSSGATSSGATNGAPAVTGQDTTAGTGHRSSGSTSAATMQVTSSGTPGASGVVPVLLADRAGCLVRMVRLGKAPPGGWTRALLEAAVMARLDSLPGLGCATYVPTVAVARQVRARNPRCTGYDCPRKSANCDLDHDTPWPRGPTEVTNLAPRCRRHHEHKTRGLVHTRLRPDGSVDTVMLTGLVVTTRPEPLPGHAPGEGHARTGNTAA